MALISVIIPIFNRDMFLVDCLQSVLKQTFSDFEVIVVDDGSTDSTQARLRPFVDHIHLLTQTNKGPSSARNVGIKIATGQWICFLDSDDVWLPQKLEKQIAFFSKNPDEKICYTEEIWYRKGRRVNPGKKHQKYSGWIYQKMLPLCLISPSSVMVHHSIFEKIGLFDESLPACEDYDLWLRIGALYPIYLIPESLIIKKNGHEGQQSQKYWGMDRFRIKALKKMIQSGILTDQDYHATHDMLKKKCLILANGCVKRGKKKEAVHYLNYATCQNEEINEI